MMKKFIGVVKQSGNEQAGKTMRSDTRYDMYRQSALLAKWTPDVSANGATGKKTVQERRAGSEKAGELSKNRVIGMFNQGGVA